MTSSRRWLDRVVALCYAMRALVGQRVATMLRLRTLRGWGGRIALLAMWLQLGLGFGHIHPSDIYGPLGHPVVVDHGLVQAAPQPPAAPEPLADLACPICATMALAASLVLPAPPLLPLPTSIAAPAASFAAPPLLVAAPYLLFAIRAPPLA